MRKGRSTTIIVSSLILLLAASPLVAASARTSSSSVTAGVTDRIEDVWLSSGLDRLMAWLGKSFSQAGDRLTTEADGRAAEDPDKPRSPEGPMEIAPMTGGTSDPDG